MNDFSVGEAGQKAGTRHGIVILAASVMPIMAIISLISGFAFVIARIF